MEVKYKSSRKEIWSFYWHQWFYGELKWIHARYFLLVALVVYFFKMKTIAWSVSAFLMAFISGLASVIWMPIYPQIKFKPQIRTLSVSENGISTSIGKCSGYVAWSEVASVSQLNGNIYIVGVNGNGFVVPARAFSGVDEKNKFFDLCLQYSFQSRLHGS